ncbi:transporter substrate-binding domain-containing protein [Burkholderia sp. WSM2232]|uniref:transporter substrate-binding domain-containing protein n=1 Tax=Burkholderia sp. WSM2232 TaxID=944436 RepID=UPI000A06B0CC|nr:transporter substrate-binding domain-containing protein [Burkholderia sp. WSM2232]
MAFLKNSGGCLRSAAAGVSLAIALVGTAKAADSTWQDVKARGVVRVGVIPARQCYYWQSPGSDEWKGFPVAMSRDAVDALSQAMGEKLKIEYVTTSWGTSVLDVQSGKIDFFIGLAETPQRKQAVSMFGPLWTLPDVAVGRKGFNIDNTWAALNKPATRVAVAMGTTSEQAAKKYLADSQIRSLKNSNDAILDVQSGKSDITLTTAIAGLAAMKVNQNLSNMVVPHPLSAIPADGVTRRDGDGKFYDFLQKWATKYYADGNTKKRVLEALGECGLDPKRLPSDMVF